MNKENATNLKSIYFDWTELHVDFCNRFPKSPAFYKLWFPTYVILYGWIYGLKIEINIRTGKHIFNA